MEETLYNMDKFHTERIFHMFIAAYGWNYSRMVAAYEYDFTSCQKFRCRRAYTGSNSVSAIFRTYFTSEIAACVAVLFGYIDIIHCDVLQSVVVYGYGKLYTVCISGSLGGNRTSFIDDDWHMGGVTVF